jgi:hypothetical protein
VDKGAGTFNAENGLYDGGYRVGMVKLASGSESGAATCDIDLTGYTAYQHKLLRLRRIVPGTDATSTRLQVSTTAAAPFTYDAGATDYKFSAWQQSSAGGDAAQVAATTTSIALTQNVGTALTRHRTYVDIEFSDTPDGDLYPSFEYKARVSASANVEIIGLNGIGMRQAGQDTTAVRIFQSSGTISLEWELYGWA